MIRSGALALLFTALAAASAPSARADKVVGLAPLSTVGDSGAKERRQLERHIASGIQEIDGASVLRPEEMSEAAERADKKQLKLCDGDVTCLAELGRVAGAELVVYGEAGGLGDAQVVYLKVVDVASAKELRSTTLEIGGQSDKDDAAVAAATRLLRPDHYVGVVALDIDTDGALVFINGKLIGKSPISPQRLPVGSHALRITHPEYRDHVRWLDVGFADQQKVEVALSQYPIVDRELAAVGGSAAAAPTALRTQVEPLPWYRQWYTIAGGGVLVFAASAAIVSALSGDLDVDRVRDL